MNSYSRNAKLFFTEIGPSLSRDVTEVDKSFEEFLTETDKNLFLKKHHQHMFLHYYQKLYQNFASQRRLD